MWAWLNMMSVTSVIALMILVNGAMSLPTKSTNDRPIIGILAQEVDNSLADVLALISKDEIANIFELNQGKPRINKRDLDGTRLDLLEEEEEVSGHEGHEHLEEQRQDLEPNVSQESGRTAESSSSEEEDQEPYQENDSASVVPTTTTEHPPLPENKTYIAASYVKFVEGGGARVVPIFINQNREYYEDIMKSINGVLFPGGAVAIDETSGFGRAGKIIYEIAKTMNDNGNVFPLWGTCLGFELLMGLAAQGQDIRAECDAQNTANRLKLDADYANGYLLRHLPKRLIKALTTKPITSNFHHYCITPKNFTSYGVDKVYRALAFSADRRGVEYIAAAEAWDYPFFAVQFHPEKSPYEWTTKPGHNQIPHSDMAIDTANHFAQVYVNFARRNKNRFDTPSKEESSLIYNYSPIYTGQYSPMEQIYVF